MQSAPRSRRRRPLALRSRADITDPNTGEPGAAFEEATRADVHEAVSAADDAFRSGALRDPQVRANGSQQVRGKNIVNRDEVSLFCEF